MKAIVVVDENWGIGREGGLLVHLSGDLKYFKEKTLGKVLVMGSQTLQSMPGGRPLPGRTTIVLSRNPEFKADCPKCASMEELFRLLEGYDSEDVFVAGGANIYEQFLPRCHVFYVTKIFARYEADRFFPNLDEMVDLDMVWQSDVMEENGVRYQFLEYRKQA